MNHLDPSLILPSLYPSFILPLSFPHSLLPLLQDWADLEVVKALQWSLKTKAVSSPGALDHAATGLMVSAGKGKERDHAAAGLLVMMWGR